MHKRCQLRVSVHKLPEHIIALISCTRYKYRPRCPDTNRARGATKAQSGLMRPAVEKGSVPHGLAKKIGLKTVLFLG